MAGRLVPAGLIAMVLVASSVATAQADTIATGWNEDTEIYELVFPVDGDNRYDDTWGACRGKRCQRRHEGTDIMAAKMVPVVAAAAGTVGWIKNEQGGDCCAMALNHDDGWRTWYIHLNNDTPGTDDGLGWGFAPGIERGVHVEAGQLLGWVGDSGNAESTPPHIHFELQRPDGKEVNPYPHLRAAEDRALAEAVAEEAAFTDDLFEGVAPEITEPILRAVANLNDPVAVLEEQATVDLELRDAR